MAQSYTIRYTATNTYEASANEALWQFLVTPEDNETQNLESWIFKNSLNIPVEESINGYGFKTFRIHPKKEFSKIDFEAQFKLTKKEMNPFNRLSCIDKAEEYKTLDDLEFKTNFESFLRETSLTKLPKNETGHVFDRNISIFDNLKNLNTWVFENFSFKTDVTDVDTNLDEILKHKQGVCQDFTHLFCAIARYNKVPTRYISGYLHQGQEYFGDSQMHAWVESYVPGTGWMGFDPTNNLLTAENHIKVAHGKDYSDCPSIKGIVYTSGANATTYAVEVSAQQQQQ